MRSFTILAVASLLVAAPAVAQGDHSQADRKGPASGEGMPEGWLVRFDRSTAGPDMLSFDVMEPGWHVTTGGRGSGIFWRPETTAAGEYQVSATMHLMQPAQHAEAFGIFVGGQQLEADDQSYLYFLVRQNGQYLIKRRRGAETENVVGWTAHEAVPTAAAGASTRYDLGIDVGAETVDFIVNGSTVHSVPRAQLQTDGVAGLRINHMLDVHVESLEVTESM